ncbi:MAG: hypothetical protein WCS15_10920 [Prevotella sp.]
MTDVNLVLGKTNTVSASNDVVAPYVPTKALDGVKGISANCRLSYKTSGTASWLMVDLQSSVTGPLKSDYSAGGRLCECLCTWQRAAALRMSSAKRPISEIRYGDWQ